VNSTQNMQDIYQQMILEHNKNPRNFREIPAPAEKFEGYNPLCGDHLWLYIKVNENNIIEDISFQGKGCAISKASASLMTTQLKGKNLEEAKSIFEEFHKLLIHELDPELDQHNLGKLKVFSGIWKFPARVKCASLAWHTLKSGLEGKKESVKTE